MPDKRIIFAEKKVKNSISSGFMEVFSSFRFARENKGITKYYILPFMLNLIILTAVLYFAYTGITPRVQSFLAGEQWYMQLLSTIVSPIIFIALMILTVFIYSIAGSIIASPFLDFLSLKTEEILTGEKFDEPFTLAAFIEDMVRITKNILKLTILIIMINIFLLLLNLIPGGSLVYAALNFFITSFFYGFQFFDYPLERRRYTFGEKLKICWKFRYSVCGNGAAFFILSFIPVAGFLGLNSATVGATALFVKDMKPALTE